MIKKILKAVFGGVGVGIANVIPGVSGGTLMVIMGIFDRTMTAISDFFKPKNPHRGKDFLFLLEVLVGMGVGILGFAKLLKWLFAVIPMPTIFWFVGLVALSVPVFKRTQMKGMSISPLPCALGVLIILALTAVQMIWFPQKAEGTMDALPTFSALLCGQLFVSGIVGGFSMLLPGVSGSLMMMIMGVYDLVVLGYIGNIGSVLKNLSGDTFLQLVPLVIFGVGVVLGIVISAKITAFALKKNQRATLSFLLGLVAASVVSIVCLNLDKMTADPWMIGGSVAAFAFGGAIVWLLGRVQEKS
ncbi:MAG: DUF368 domain-containing protein [Clostridia bacterium]|nr:DUF368 domain-containing protein [Clostridia bacterium]